jgi:predicted 3-demethylubiquinone-9 3-methyltransferase (glyoxalase superfamily)
VPAVKPILLSLLLFVPALLLGASDPDQHDSGTTSMPHQKITTCLWFQNDAEEALRFYTSIFKDAKVVSESRWGEGGPAPKGSLMAATFQLAGQEFMVLNGRPDFDFNESVSLMVSCQTQAEIDEYWQKLSAGSGEAGRCGWLKDRFGVSWQIVPSVLGKLLSDPDPAKAKRVGAALMQMSKLDIARLQQAYDGR